MYELVKFFKENKKMYSIDSYLFNSSYRVKDALYDLSKNHNFVIYDFFNYVSNLDFNAYELIEGKEEIYDSEIYEVNRKLLDFISASLETETPYCAWFSPFDVVERKVDKDDNVIYEMEFNEVRCIIIGVDERTEQALIAFDTPPHCYDHENITLD